MPALVGRINELEILKSRLRDAISGKGSTIFISGEAGAGKTRLADECIKAAAQEGFRVLRGWCMESSLTPFMPIREALASGGLDRLIAAEAPPKLETLYLMTNTGLLISKAERERTPGDSDIFTGMLTAVNEFIMDSIKQMGKPVDGNVSRIGHGSFNMAAVHGKMVTLASVFTGRENEGLLADMESALSEVENEFGEKLRNWDGTLDKLSGTQAVLGAIFSTEKYDGVDWSGEDPKYRQGTMFENIAGGIARAARMNPVLMFIDDLQWADPSSVALLHYVSRNTKNSGVIVIGAFRPEETQQSWDGKAHHLASAIHQMAREDILEKIELENLSGADMPALLESCLGKPAGGDMPDFSGILYRETSGNPLFIAEMLKLLEEEHAIVRSDAGWSLEMALHEINVPSKILDVIERRLARLPKEYRRLLETASVIGEMFSPEVLSAVSETRKIDILRMLNEIEKVHMLVEPADKLFRFSNSKIKDVLYSGISPELRNEYHLMVGNAIAGIRPGDDDETAAETGFHFYRAGDKAHALPCLMKAMNIARSKYSNDEVIRLSGYAIELADEKKWEPERLKALETRGDTLDIAGAYDGAVKSYEDALSISPDGVTKARMLRKIGTVLSKKGENARALDELEKGRSMLEGSASPELGRILSKLGLIFDQTGDFEKGKEMVEDALRIFSFSSALDKDVADAYTKLGHILSGRGDYDGAMGQYTKSLELFRKTGDLRGIATSSSNIAYILSDIDRYEQALGLCDDALKTFEKIGDRQSVGVLLNNMGIIHKSRGNYDTALNCYKKAIGILRRLGNMNGIAGALNNIGNIHSFKGEPEKALECYRDSMELFNKMGDRRGVGGSLVNIASILVSEGKYETALEKLEESKKIADETKDNRLMIDVNHGMGDARFMMRDYVAAADCLNRAIELSRNIGIRDIEGASLKLLGMIASVKGDWAEAKPMFAKSISVLSGAGIDGELAEAYLEYGRMLAWTGENDEAKKMYADAIKLFDRMRNADKADETRKELEKLS